MRSTKERFHLRIKTHFIAIFSHAKEEKLYNTVFSVELRTAGILILVREIKKETIISYTLGVMVKFRIVDRVTWSYFLDNT
jgi:hypothetical protein